MWKLILILLLGCRSFSDKGTTDASDSGVTVPTTETQTGDTSQTDSDSGTASTDTQPPEDPDADGDGSPASADCDDSDASAFPGNPEVCDDVDNDCNGLVDDGLDQTWYWDQDSDGYGVDLTTTDCAQPSGYAAESGDCNDVDPAINPDATEICNTLDDDCNGTADDAGTCPCDSDHYPDAEHPYLYCQDAGTWDAAEATCEGYGYALVTFDSQAELDHVTSVAGSLASNYWWVGFTDTASEGSWQWIDGSPTTYQNWCSGEPNNSHGGECVGESTENCAMLNWGSGGCWNDYPCSCDWPFYICEGSSESRPDDD